MASQDLNVDGLCFLTCSPVSLRTRHHRQHLVSVLICLFYIIVPLLNQRMEHSHRPIETADRYCVPRRITGLWFGFVWAGSLCNRTKRKQKSRVDQPFVERARNCHTKGELGNHRLMAKRTEKRGLAHSAPGYTGSNGAHFLTEVPSHLVYCNKMIDPSRANSGIH